ncbi:MAG: DUF5611 family protein [Euryarchaeota archaeon]|nr:DUF5611 family protein [Euryarchaeota archaeon]MBU4222375.1 DUF5611 family protein [Euryarchaeota archaeon]
MQEYAFKRGFSQDISRIRELLAKNLPAGIKEENGKLEINYGALTRLVIEIKNKRLCVETEANKGAQDNVIMDTNKRFRVFLEEATGYTAKERLKKAKKDVQGD